MVLNSKEEHTNQTDPVFHSDDDTPGTWTGMPSNFVIPKKKIKLQVRLITEVAIDADILSELSSVPVETVQEIINGTFELVSDSFSPFTPHEDILKKTVTGLFRYKYQDKTAFLDMLQKVEDDLTPFGWDLPMQEHYNGLAAENINKVIDKFETFKSLVELIKILNITTPLNIDEFRLEHRATIVQDTSSMPNYPHPWQDAAFVDTAFLTERRMFERAQYFLSEFGITVIQSKQQKEHKNKLINGLNLLL